MAISSKFLGLCVSPTFVVRARKPVLMAELDHILLCDDAVGVRASLGVRFGLAYWLGLP
ncbi:hypothetical protein [Pseudovibrio sp. Tun.PSC04-5.I4]|uniref:hypothetical protein n=1 Tax=Pseudovibrio sp. Tun.PSC04-5.I4 TaxID=1798213 RepID=UPI0013564458|nr:hypothetical protein [Pseudovibrio sp. Tun.PSC04-5.I4]